MTAERLDGSATLKVMVAVDLRNSTMARRGFTGILVLILGAQLLLFGSRLNALLAVLGAWVVWYYSGRQLPVRRIVAGALLVLLVSVPIVSQRPGGDDAGLPAIERYSRIAGYGVLDAAMAVRERPAGVREKLRDGDRWANLPLYVAPPGTVPDRPNVQKERLDLYVAQSLGDRNQQTTGFPTTFITEWWLYAGWVGVALASIALGLLLGWVRRRADQAIRPGPVAGPLLCYCFVVVTAFSYYKDGDLIMTIVGAVRLATYLGALMLLTGVLEPLGTPARRILTRRRGGLRDLPS